MAGSAAAGAQGHTDSAAAGAAGAAAPKTDDAAAAAAAAAGGDKGKGADGDAGKGAAAAAGDDKGKAAADQGKGEEGKGGKAGDAAATPKAPDKYSLAIPDDAKDYVDATVLSEVEAIARESGWSNEDAQNAVNEHALMLKKVNDTFLTQLKADPDYGGEKLVETQRLAKAGIDLVRPEGHPRREAFTRAINRIAAGNHPEFVSFLADLGRRSAEDTPGQSTGASKAGQKTAEDVLYPKKS